MKRRYVFLFALAALLARLAALRIWPALDGDCAVFALMAKHVAELREFPVYMWENHYAGALMSYLAAALFAFFGVSTRVFLWAGVIFSLCWASFGFLLCRRFLSGSGLAAALLLLSIPMPNVLKFSVFTGGVHAENLLMGTLIIWSVLYPQRIFAAGIKAVFITGVLCGLGLWLTPGVFPFVCVAIWAIAFSAGKKRTHAFMVFFCGILCGSLPAVVYNIVHPAATLLRLGGRMFYLDRTALHHGFVLAFFKGVIARFSSIGASLMRIPMLFFQLLGVFNGLLVICCAILAVFLAIRSLKKEGSCGTWQLVSVGIVSFILFYSCAVGENAPRYVLPLYVLVPLVVGKTVSLISARKRAAALVLVALLFLNNAGALARSFVRPATNQYAQLAQCLSGKGIKYAFADYWTAYPVIFESREQVLVSPTLYDPLFAERYPQYTAGVVASAGLAVFILDPGSLEGTPAEFEAALNSHGIVCERSSCGRFLVYERLSRTVSPRELGLTMPGK